MATTDRKSVTIVGCGKMGEAILAGWLDEKVMSPDDICIVSPEEPERKRQAEEYGVDAVDSVDDLAGSARAPFDVVLLAVKPQVMPEVLSDLASHASSIVAEDVLYITIAAGIRTSEYEKVLGEDTAHVVRVMPNMPLQVGMGASVVTGGRNATEREVEYVNGLFELLGVSSIVAEDQVDAAGAISGGGPAYFAYMLEALTKAGAELGLGAELTSQLVLETMGGTYKAMVDKGMSAEEMRVSVCSPGGTTLAAIGSLDHDGFVPSIERAMEAAVKRAAELGS